MRELVECIAHYDTEPCGHATLRQVKGLTEGSSTESTTKTVMLHLEHRSAVRETSKGGGRVRETVQSGGAESSRVRTNTDLSEKGNARPPDQKTEKIANVVGTGDASAKVERGRGMSLKGLEGPSAAVSRDCKPRDLENVSDRSRTESIESSPHTPDQHNNMATHNPDVDVIITFTQRTWANKADPLKNGASATTPWPRARFACPSALAISRLHERCREELEHRVREDSNWDSALDQRLLEIAFLASIPAPDTPKVHVRLGDSRLNVSVVGDLFPNPLAKNTLEVYLVFAPRSRKVAVPEDDLLMWEPDVAQIYENIRVGSTVDRVPPSDEPKGSKRAAGLKQIAAIRPLLAWISPGYSPSLFSVSAYEFDGYCIGQSCSDSLYWEEDYTKHEFASRHELIEPFAGISNLDALAKAIATYRRLQSPMIVGSGMPFLPSYCFNNLDENNETQQDFGLNGARPEDSIYAAVRCVNHVKAPKGSGFTGPEFIWFPDIVLSISATKGGKTVCKRVMDILRASEVRTKVGEQNQKNLLSSSALWKQPLSDTWNVQIWVSPQSPGRKNEDRKMYCLTRHAEETHTPLWQFLNADAWKKNDRRLYLEAHIVPKDLNAWVVTGSIVESPAPSLENSPKTKTSASPEHQQEQDEPRAAERVEVSDGAQDDQTEKSVERDVEGDVETDVEADAAFLLEAIGLGQGRNAPESMSEDEGQDEDTDTLADESAANVNDKDTDTHADDGGAGMNEEVRVHDNSGATGVAAEEIQDMTEAEHDELYE